VGVDVAVPVAVEVGVRVAGGGYAPGASVGGGGTGVLVNVAAEAINAISAEATSSPVRSSTALPVRATEVDKDVWGGTGPGASAGIVIEM